MSIYYNYTDDDGNEHEVNIPVENLNSDDFLEMVSYWLETQGEFEEFIEHLIDIDDNRIYKLIKAMRTHDVLPNTFQDE